MAGGGAVLRNTSALPIVGGAGAGGCVLNWARSAARLVVAGGPGVAAGGRGVGVGAGNWKGAGGAEVIQPPLKGIGGGCMGRKGAGGGGYAEGIQPPVIGAGGGAVGGKLNGGGEGPEGIHPPLTGTAGGGVGVGVARQATVVGGRAGSACVGR